MISKLAASTTLTQALPMIPSMPALRSVLPTLSPSVDASTDRTRSEKASYARSPALAVGQSRPAVFGATYYNSELPAVAIGDYGVRTIMALNMLNTLYSGGVKSAGS